MSAREDGLDGFYMYKDTVELLNTVTVSVKVVIDVKIPQFDTVPDAVYPSAYTFYSYIVIPKSGYKIVIS